MRTRNGSRRVAPRLEVLQGLSQPAMGIGRKEAAVSIFDGSPRGIPKFHFTSRIRQRDRYEVRRMGNSDRPLSPHLQIYKPQLTAALSIAHRATGVFLVIGALLLVYWLISLAGGPDSYAQAQAFFGSLIGRVILLPWVFALFYHLCNGIRHLLWDMGVGFEISTVYTSGKVVVVAAVALTLITFAMAYTMRGGAV